MEVGLIVACSPSFRPKALYTFRTLLFTIGVKFRLIEDFSGLVEGQVILYYGPQSSSFKKFISANNPVLAILTDSESERYFESKKVYPFEQVKHFSGGAYRDIPVLFYTPHFALTGQCCEINGTSMISLHVDLVASAFYFLSCWQEYTNLTRDAFDRFPYDESIQKKLEITGRPVVNEYLVIIKELITDIAQKNHINLDFQPLWPSGKTFALALTHDIDHVQKWRWNTFHREIKVLAKIIAQRRVREFLRRTKELALYLVKNQDPYWVYNQLIKRETQANCSSSFYFLGGQSHKTYDRGYSLPRKKVQKLLKDMVNRGVEIGLHGSFETYRSHQLLAEEYSNLSDLISGTITGCRQHYLRLDLSETFNHLEAAGLQYDTTLGFAESQGFRASFAFPFFPYDILRNRPHQILEIPLVVMDTTLESYRGLDKAAGALVLLENLEVLAVHNGCGSLLWHNGYFDELDFPGYGELYWQSLDWLRDQGGWGASGREINNWWRGRISALSSPELS